MVAAFTERPTRILRSAPISQATPTDETTATSEETTSASRIGRSFFLMVLLCMVIGTASATVAGPSNSER